jgi:hypothetical protein
LFAVAPSALAAGDAVQIRIVEDTGDRLVLEYMFDAYQLDDVMIEGKPYVAVSLDREPPLKVAGAPELPHVCRSVIIPDDAAMAVRVLDAEFEEVDSIDVAPSKGFILRTVDPASVPYTFGAAYAKDAFFPGPVASLREPYILRNYRGTVVDFNPFQYNPVTRTLRVYSHVTLEIASVGAGTINVLDREEPSEEKSAAFHQIYKSHFLNYRPPMRYDPLSEEGEMLIIYHDPWAENIQPLVDHKNSIGIQTTAVAVSSIGTGWSQIKDYIQEVYDTTDLAFVLLVGDGAQIDTPSASGGSSDPTYSKLDGSDDYPDILVGRFSAETPAHVDTQVERTITYELMPATEQEWFRKGTGVASNQGPGDDGEYDDEHMDNIRDDLLAYGYTEVDRIYDYSGTAAMVTAALNEGRGVVNYTGHGSTTSWGSTGFSVNHVNDLENDNMLPFIVSVACVNGQFDGYTCFGEAWLRATHDSVPTGAIGAYMSSINQSWNPPMAAQDESCDLLCAEAYFSFGALCFAGSCLMMDEYGYGGVEMFDTWHVFGDPSVRVFGRAYQPAVQISLPDGPPKFVPPRRPTSITVRIQEGQEVVAPETARLHYRLDGDTYADLPLTALGDDLFEAVLPAASCGMQPEFYFSAAGVEGTTDYYPMDAPDNVFTAEVATAIVKIDDNFEFDQGWLIESEDMSDGVWQRGVPVGDGSRGDPITDYDQSGQCYLTANRAGNSDVDGGPTHMTSPRLDLTGLADPVLNYARWFYNDDEDEDRLVVALSADGGDSWVTVESVSWTGSGELAWVPRTVHIADYIPLSNQVKVRFSTADNPNNSVTEAAIDAVEVIDVSCSMAANGDYDMDGDVDLVDFRRLVDCFDGPADGACGAAFDFDEDGVIGMADYASFAVNMSGPRG